MIQPMSLASAIVVSVISVCAVGCLRYIDEDELKGVRPMAGSKPPSAGAMAGSDYPPAGVMSGNEPPAGVMSGNELLAAAMAGNGQPECAGEAPLAHVQWGVCGGARQVCSEGSWLEPDYADIEGFEEIDLCSNGVDDDCDGEVDEVGCLAVCGDGVTEGVEECDDGNVVTELCAYGEVSCIVCSTQCTSVAGVTAYCGDGVWNGVEQCDGESWCNAQCIGTDPRPCASASGGCPTIEWVFIEGGTFDMGSINSSDEQPIHSVTVPTFEMMKTEVTVDMYRACVDARYCTAPGCTGSSTNCNYTINSPNNPINYVSWHQLMKFAAWVGGRLPTEAEWEFAASSRGTSVYPWGSDLPACSLVDYYDYEDSSSCNGDGTSPTCNTPLGNSAQGLCDLGGNVDEWVQDEYHSNYEGAPTNGSGWCTGTCPTNARDSTYRTQVTTARIARGGSWRDNAHYHIRAARRGGVFPGNQDSTIGGRLARSLQ
jgi:formylglycine-generating enzyme required for sulfatase activity